MEATQEMKKVFICDIKEADCLIRISQVCKQKEYDKFKEELKNLNAPYAEFTPEYSIMIENVTTGESVTFPKEWKILNRISSLLSTAEHNIHLVKEGKEQWKEEQLNSKR